MVILHVGGAPGGENRRARRLGSDKVRLVLLALRKPGEACCCVWEVPEGEGGVSQGEIGPRPEGRDFLKRRGLCVSFFDLVASLWHERLLRSCGPCASSTWPVCVFFQR